MTKASTESPSAFPAELIAFPTNELRVILSWDADATDIDLWVTDPTGETVMYSRNRGQTGGHVSNDFTQGYGPEIFTIARALPGTYTVHANYYGNRQQKLSGATTVQLEFQTAFGNRREQNTVRDASPDGQQGSDRSGQVHLPPAAGEERVKPCGVDMVGRPRAGWPLIAQRRLGGRRRLNF